MSSAAQRPSPTRVTSWLVLTTLFWGGSFIFNKIGFREIPPIPFLALRFLLATLLMGLACLPRLRALDRKVVRTGALLGVALWAVNLSFVIGLSGTTATRAGFLNNLFVLLIPCLCFLVWRERLSRPVLAGVSLAVAGLWALAGGGAGGGFSRGDLISTVCALFIAIHIIMVSRLLSDEDVFLVSLVQFATVATLGLALVAVLPSQPFRIGLQGGTALGYCAVFPTVLCFTLQNTWQRYTTPTQAGLIYTLDPVWSLLGGMVVLGERLTGREWLGCGLVFAAVLLPLAIGRIRERSLLARYRQLPGSGRE